MRRAGASKRIEYRCPDSSSNPYLAMAAVLMAALDGIQNKIAARFAARQRHLRPATPKISGRPAHARFAGRGTARIADRSRLSVARRRLHEDVIDTWIWYKTIHEVEALRQRPHPWEFAMYFDI